MKDIHGFEETLEAVIINVVARSQQINLEMEADDITKLLAFYGDK